MKIFTFDLTGKNIIITGGYGHLGSAITNSLLFHGATVFLLGKDIKKFNKAFDLKNDLYKNLNFIHCDISSTSDVKKAYAEVVKQQIRVDVLINNAYFIKGQSPDLMTDEDWSYGIDGTLNCVYRCIREIIPYFREQSRGKIINVSSMYGIVSPDFTIYDKFPSGLNPPHYGAAKAGVIQMTKYFANYLGMEGITVNAITPGPFPSEVVQQNTEFVTELAKRTSLNRIGKPEDLAGAFVFLSSEMSNYITGQNIIVDGGWTSR